MRAVIYARYSSDKQSDRSVEDQVALCEDFARREGLNVTAHYDDRALSGASTIGRLGLQRLMADGRARKFDIVLAESLDRISRDQEDLAGIYKRLSFFGIEIRTVADGRAGDIHVGIKGLMGALYLKDLAAKTHRGMMGVIRDGRSASGRSYGYQTIPGQPGALAIAEAEAAVVRRIFADYTAGMMPREIAGALNREGIPAPRGGIWAGSTINGSRARANGIVNNALYVGRLTWNRQRFEKDPDTGKRVSRPNPREQWVTIDRPDLRIVDDETWQAAQARKTAGALKPQRGPSARHLFSGLLRCGCCGGPYVITGTDSRGPRFGCSRRRETMTCDNTATVGARDIEQRILDGIEQHLGDPELVAEFVRAYHAERQALRSAERSASAADERRLAEIDRKIAAMVAAIEDGASARPMAERMRALEAEREQIIARKPVEADDQIVSFHPAAADNYRRQIRSLRAMLAEATDEAARRAAVHEIRSMVEKVVIVPTKPYQPVDLEIHGQLAGLLGASREAARSVGMVVAGARFELTTFRL